MAAGVEVRVPYCDHRLVEYVFGTPWKHKSFDGREKSLLRAATADLLPQSVVQRVKACYPSIQDPAYDAILRAQFARLLENRNAAVRPLLVVDSHYAALGASNSSVDARRRWDMEQVLRLDDFLTDYNVSLAI